MTFCPPVPKHPRIIEYSGEGLKARVKKDEDFRGKKLKARAKKDKIFLRTLRSTACWRGYQGTWEIKNGRFYLVDPTFGRRKAKS
jgi:hypothetical protein